MRQPAQSAPRDEVLDILRRLEPALIRLDDRVRKVETDISRLDGRLTELSSKAPTLWQIIGAVLGINAGIVAIAFGLSRILAP
jgi:hypothetical protein